MESTERLWCLLLERWNVLAEISPFLSDNELGEAAKVIGRSIYETFPDMRPRWREIDVRVLAGEELSEEDFACARTAASNGYGGR